MFLTAKQLLRLQATGAAGASFRQAQMSKRPFVIFLIAICYLISPVFILIQAATVSNTALIGDNSIFSRLLPVDWILMGVYFVAAVAIFSIRKWGWYLFLLCSFYLVFYNVTAAIENPAGNLLSVIAYNLVLILVTGIVFRRHVMAPYFNPQLRWWQNQKRIKINLTAEIILDNAVLDAEILDISTEGCFVELGQNIALGDLYHMNLHCLRQQVKVCGRVVHRAKKSGEFAGYGVMFIEIADKEKVKLKDIIDDLVRAKLQDSGRESRKGADQAGELPATTPRFNLVHNAVIEKPDASIRCRVVDVSKTGCYLTTAENLREGDVFKLRLLSVRHEIMAQARIKRAHRRGAKNGYGVEFTDISAAESKKLNEALRTFSEIGAAQRNIDDVKASEELAALTHGSINDHLARD